jgi:hypothetical protein
MAKITYTNKVKIKDIPVAEVNKFTADNANEIKTIVNELDDIKDNIANKSQAVETDKLSVTKYPSVKALYDWAVGKFQSILVSGSNIKTINGSSILGSGDITIGGGGGGSGDMVLADAQTVSGLKTFLNGMFGLRNVANTFTSFFTNTNTASRTYTLPNKDGTIAMLSDVISPNSVNEFTEIQKFTKGVYLLDESTSTNIKKLIVRSNPSNSEAASTNPWMYDFVAKGRFEANGWFGGFNFYSKDSVQEILMMKLATDAFGINQANIYGNLVLSGNLTLGGALTQAYILLARNSNKIIDAGNYENLTYAVKGFTTSPYRIVEYRASAGGGPGWHAKQQFWVKSHNDTVERLAFEIESKDNGIPIIRALGDFKPNQLDLSGLGLYATDAAAATGGVAVGFAYINSSTGTVQRRLV